MGATNACLCLVKTVSCGDQRFRALSGTIPLWWWSQAEAFQCGDHGFEGLDRQESLIVVVTGCRFFVMITDAGLWQEQSLSSGGGHRLKCSNVVTTILGLRQAGIPYGGGHRLQEQSLSSGGGHRLQVLYGDHRCRDPTEGSPLGGHGLSLKALTIKGMSGA
eukprot:1160241-Pelagomonas_calceolata.AAC.2